MLTIQRFVCGPLQNNMYLVTDQDNKACAVVDPAIDSIAVIEHIRDHELAVSHILLTHGHFDHAFSLAEYKEMFKAPVAIHPGDVEFLEVLPETATSWGINGAKPCPEPDILLAHGQDIEIGGGKVKVLHTPGHSPGQVAYVIPGHAIVGDTLFWRGIGRYDLPGSDYHALERSIKEQLYTLPADTKVWPGHGDPTTIGDEIKHNPYIGEGARFKPHSGLL